MPSLSFGEQMNFLLVSPDYLPNLGGISMMAHGIASGLVKSGHVVHMMAPFSETPEAQDAGYTYIYDKAARPEIVSGDAWTDIERPRILKKFDEISETLNIERILSFHPHYYGQALMAWKASRAKNGQSSPSIGSVYHGLELLTCLRWPKIKQDLHERFLQRQASHREEVLATVKRSDTLFSNSQYTGSLVTRIARSRTAAVIGCGVSEKWSEVYADISSDARLMRRLSARRTLKLPEDIKLVGTVSRLVPHKNIEAMIDLIAVSPKSVHGLIAGTGPHKPSLMAHISRAGLESRIHFREIPDEAGKWNAIEALDQFLLLSKLTRDGGVEGFGIVMLEAMMAGIPVITSGTGGMADVIIHGETGFIVPQKKGQKLLKASQDLLTDDERQNRIVILAQERVKTEFLWTHVCHRLLAAWDIN